MSAQITKIPNRNELIQQHEEQARLYLRDFDPKRYTTYYSRIYDADAYLTQISIDIICELIERIGDLASISKILDISSRTLRSWINRNPVRVQQVKEAYVFAGEAFAHKAEQVLRDVAGGTKEEISLASKLADHYRWMASRLDREKFGESVKVDPNSTKAPMNITLNFAGTPTSQEQLIQKTKPLIADFLRLSEEEPE